MKIVDHLIADARNWHRFWSVRIAAIGVAFEGVWVALPADMRADIPGGQWIGLGLFALTAFSRVVQQRKLGND